MRHDAELSDVRGRDADRLPALFHELSQPLTTVQCSLEVSLMNATSGRQRRACIEQALKETGRVIEMLRELRSILGK